MQKKWLFPHATAKQYAKDLKKLANDVNFKIEQITQTRADDVADWRMEWLRQLALIPEQFDLSFEQVALAIKATAEQVNRFNYQQFQSVVSSATNGLKVVKPEPMLSDLVKEWARENVALIKSIPEQQAENVRKIIEQSAQESISQADLIKKIKKAGKLTKDRAELIAQDQVGKLNGQLMQMRQQNIGVKQYRWRGTLDSRERDSHLKREGKIFSWDNPPSDGHPGKAIRCRCWASMILPELSDINAQLFGDGGDNRHYQAEMARRGLTPDADMPELADDIYKAFGFVPRGTV